MAEKCIVCSEENLVVTTLCDHRFCKNCLYRLKNCPICRSCLGLPTSIISAAVVLQYRPITFVQPVLAAIQQGLSLYHPKTEYRHGLQVLETHIKDCRTTEELNHRCSQLIENQKAVGVSIGSELTWPGVVEAIRSKAWDPRPKEPGSCQELVAFACKTGGWLPDYISAYLQCLHDDINSELRVLKSLPDISPDTRLRWDHDQKSCEHTFLQNVVKLLTTSSSRKRKCESDAGEHSLVIMHNHLHSLLHLFNTFDTQRARIYADRQEDDFPPSGGDEEVASPEALIYRTLSYVHAAASGSLQNIIGGASDLIGRIKSLNTTPEALAALLSDLSKQLRQWSRQARVIEQLRQANLEAENRLHTTYTTGMREITEERLRLRIMEFQNNMILSISLNESPIAE